MSPFTQLCLTRPLVPSKSVIDCPTEKADILAELAAAWGCRNRTGVPGSNPVSISRRQLAAMSGAYAVGLKSDGVRYILFLSLRSSGSPRAVMIDRASNIYEVEVLAPAECFIHGTILEGELVWRTSDPAAMLYCVFDVVRLQGQSLLGRRFGDRIAVVDRLTRLSEEVSKIDAVAELEARVAETGCLLFTGISPSIVVRPKHFVSIEHAETLWQARNEAQYAVDGLIIHNVEASYRQGAAFQSIYKWKPVHTVDLLGAPDALAHADGALGDTIRGRRVVVVPSRVVVDASTVAEYHVDCSAADEVRLFAVRTRTDKQQPNTLRVVEATLSDAVEGIQPSDLATLGRTPRAA